MAEKNVKTVNMLGDTPKIQWNNAINIYRMVIESNLNTLKEMADEDYFDDEEYFTSYDPQMEYLNTVDRIERTMNDVFYEMNRLVNEMFSEESEEDTEE